jgi:proline dehydrogenase
MIPPVARRFVAGEAVDDALAYAGERNAEGLGVILNKLGEHYDEPGPAEADAATYRALLDAIAERDLDACISVKPTQLGLLLDEDRFAEAFDRLAERAAANGGFVWLDMEDHRTTDATLDAYEAAARAYGDCVGVCVQANLVRTGEDLERLAPLAGTVRLVKGAYDPPEDLAVGSQEAVDAAYRDHLRYAFEHFEDGIAVASHDPAMIDLAAELHATHGTPYELQLLMGVREAAQARLATDHVVYQYAPFGGAWLSYFYRRVRERWGNLRFALRAILQG